MSTPKYNVKRARIHVEAYGSGVLRDLGNVESASASFEEQTLEKESTNEVRGVIASIILSTKGTFTMTLGNIAFENFVLATRSKTSTQSAGTASFELPAMQKGAAVKLPKTNIISATFGSLVEGTDYQVFKSSGVVVALKDITTATTGTFDYGVAKVAGITAGAEQEYTLHITDELNSEYTQFFRFKPALAQNLQSIAPNEFGAYEVTGQLMLDETKPVSGDLGQFGYKTESVASA